MKLVATLATNKRLPRVVESLVFEDPTAGVNAAQWAAVLPAMSNLRSLMITARIPLRPNVIPVITFRLTTFGSISPVDTPWTQFLAFQRQIGELLFVGRFHGDAPRLPRLHSMRGRPTDLAKFARRHRLVNMWFYTGLTLAVETVCSADLEKFAASPTRLGTLRIGIPDFLSLLEAAPWVIETVCHLVLDEDLSWSDFTLHSGAGLAASSVSDLATMLDRRFINLKSVLLVCSPTAQHRANRRMLQRSDGVCFAKVMSAYCSVPTLIFRFYAHDGYAICTDWDQDGIQYVEPSYKPHDLEIELSYLFTHVHEYY